MTEETTIGLNLKKEPSVLEQLFELGSGKKYVPRPTWDQIVINHLEGRMHLDPLPDDMPKTLKGYASYLYEKSQSKQENWDNKGNVFYTDEEGNKVESDTGLSRADKIIRRLRAVGTNTKNYIEESNTESDVYKQKVNSLFNLETQLLSLSLLRHIKPIIPSRDITYSTEDLVNNFFNRNNPKLEKMPPKYEGSRNMSDVLNYLGSQDKYSANIQTPVENVTFNNRNLFHLINDNEPQRLGALNQVRQTLKEPYYVIKEQNDKGTFYNGYYKPYLENDSIKGHFSLVKNVADGNFYTTNRPIRFNNLVDKINEGQVIYHNLPHQTAPVFDNTPVKSIINYDNTNFNPQSLNSDSEQTYPTNKFHNFINFISSLFQK
ncbi:hypothetical protein II810_03005 [bacterium]|nr:hypothetical protein [bacterium]